MSTSQLRPPPMPKTALTERQQEAKPALLARNQLKPLPAETEVLQPVAKVQASTNSIGLPVVEATQPKAPGWLRFVAPVWSGAVAALQAFALAFTLLTGLVLVALLASGEPGGWGLALAGSTRFWLMAHGARVSFGELSLHLLPLGFTALCILTLRLTSKRVPPSVTAIIAGSSAYSTAAFIASRIVGEHAQVTLQAAGGALLIGATGFASRMVPSFKKFHGLVNRCPVEYYLGLKAGALMLLSTVGLAAIFAAIWAVLGLENSRAAVATLQPGVIGSVVVGVSQLALLPNWLLWIAGWLAGPGFSMGIGSLYAPGQWQGGPLPALPIVSALPPQSWAGPYWAWVPVLVLLVGALAGWYLWRTLNNPSVFGANVGLAAGWPVLLRAGGTAVASSMLAMITLQWLARGSLGSGRLSEVGANPWLVALIFGGEVAAGVAMVFIGLQVGKR